MTTILILNAVSSAVAAVGFGFIVRANRRARRADAVTPVYVFAETPPRLPRGGH